MRTGEGISSEGGFYGFTLGLVKLNRDLRSDAARLCYQAEEEMNNALIAEYLDAFKAANPTQSTPEVSYSNGWYRLSNITGPVREDKLRDMRDVMRSRAASKT